MTLNVTNTSGLSAHELSEVFPFHIGFHADGTVVQLGRALSRLCPDLTVGASIATHVRLLRPQGGLDFEALRAAAPEFIVVELMGLTVPLRGQTLALADRVLLLVSPWITDGSQLGARLRLSDFALHDPALDYVTLLQAKNSALIDSAQMADKLHITNADLAAALAEREVSHARLSALIALLPSAIMVVDEHGRIMLFNQRASNLFGVAAGFDGLLGTELSVWADSAQARFTDPVQFLAGIANVSTQVEARTGEVLELLDGRVLERDYVPITDAAGMCGHLWQYRDVSEKRRVERELSAARARAEDANAAKSAFLAMISHEMRTPLGVIVGLAELLSQPGPQTEYDEFLRRLQANAQSLASIIEDVLDFSRLESGKMTFQDVSFDPIELATEVAKALAPSAQAKGVELVVDIDERVPSSVRGDPARLRQLLVNFVGNAVKFTDHGEIVVRVERLASSAERALLRYSVQDTGCGIPRELHDRIFERFVRVEQTARAHGTGLGLSISALLARGMGTTITLQSEPKVGSCFQFELDHRIDTLERRSARPLSGLRVAIVDPMPSARRAAAQLVRRLGAEVIEAQSHEEVTMSTESPIDVIICDDARSLQDAETLRQRATDLPSAVPTCIVLRAAVARAPVAMVDVCTLAKPLSRENLLQALVTKRYATQSVSAPSTPRPPRIHAAPAAASILVVDDDRDNQVVLKSLVSQSVRGSVAVASDGASALAMARLHAYDLILTDLQMPVSDGFELTRRIRRGEAAATRKNVPIIAVSAHALPEFTLRAASAGVNEFISKPIDRSRLRDALERWLDPRPRALVVDDCEDALLVTLRQLNAIGTVAAVAVNNGQAALDRVALGDIDVVLLDMGMPGMDGCSVVRAIRARTDLRQPHVVALTGYHAADEVQRFMEAGCDHHLVKPARLSALTGILSKLLALPAGPEQRAANSLSPAPQSVSIDQDVLDMIPGYLANRRADVTKVRQLLESAGPLNEAAQIGHRMKGTGGAYGFPRITEIGATIETLSQREDRNGTRAVIDELEQYLDAIERSLPLWTAPSEKGPAPLSQLGSAMQR